MLAWFPGIENLRWFVRPVRLSMLLLEAILTSKGAETQVLSAMRQGGSRRNLFMRFALGCESFIGVPSFLGE